MHFVIQTISDVFWTVAPPLAFIGTGVALAHAIPYAQKKFAGWKWKRAKAAWEESLMLQKNIDEQAAKDAAAARIAQQRINQTFMQNQQAFAKKLGSGR